MGEVLMPVKSLKWTVCLGVALAPWLLAVPASAADEVFSVTKIISLPNGQALGSFDIEFVDPLAGVFLLADRTNKSIDVASTSKNLITSQLQPGFVGVISSTDCAAAVAWIGGLSWWFVVGPLEEVNWEQKRGEIPRPDCPATESARP
jgi:hypothetical protein